MKDRIKLTTCLAGLLFLFSLGCGSDEALVRSGGIDPGNDPNFTIIANEDAGLNSFNRKVVVFGIDIYAVPNVEDVKLLHAANVMAQYLDNDEDGEVDDPLVLQKMLENQAFLVMWARESDLDIDPPSGRIGQDLGNDETNPDYVSGGKTERFDAALEEVLHVINNAGHSYAYSSAFGQNEGSDLANAMDIARGGKFFDIPDSYPDNAWYTYYDETCDYANCQTIEYLYWALTSMMGGQETASMKLVTNGDSIPGHWWKVMTGPFLNY